MTQLTVACIVVSHRSQAGVQRATSVGINGGSYP